MPGYSDKQFQKDLADFAKIRERSAGGDGGSKAKGKGADDRSTPSSWSCGGCGYYNFGSRRQCRHCPTPRPFFASPSSTSTRPSIGSKGGGGKGGGAKGASSKDGKSTSGPVSEGGYARLLAQFRALEEQNKALALKAATAAKTNEGDDEEPELLEDEADEDPLVSGDLDNLQALQKLYDNTLASLGAEDPTAKALRQRLDNARAKQRAAKPVFQQVQTAQRKTAKNERQLDTAKSKLAELEARKKELEQEITEQVSKVAQWTAEVDKSKAELGELLERAKAEQATTSQQVPPNAASSGAPSTGDGIVGAAAAWNAAKAAIQAQLASLPADTSRELHQAIATQYDAMERVLNQLPAAPPPQPPAPRPPPPPQQQPQADDGTTGSGKGGIGEGGQGVGTGQGTATTTTNSAAAAAASDDVKDSTTMLDIDDTTIAKLAEILAENGDDNDAADDGDGGDTETGNSRKSRRTMDSRVAAAKQYLALRKPHFRKTGK